MSLAKLQNTTIMSTELTHARLKHLAAKIGVTEDIVSRLALGISIREGKISEDWKPKENQNYRLTWAKAFNTPSNQALFLDNILSLIIYSNFLR